MKWYKYTWEDGTITVAGGYDKTELANMIRDHGRLLSVVKI